jgi:hypothetical protein
MQGATSACRRAGIQPPNRRTDREGSSETSNPCRLMRTQDLTLCAEQKKAMPAGMTSNPCKFFLCKYLGPVRGVSIKCGWAEHWEIELPLAVLPWMFTAGGGAGDPGIRYPGGLRSLKPDPAVSLHHTFDQKKHRDLVKGARAPGY